MSYSGDDNTAAPTLNTVDLTPDEAKSLLAETLRSIEVMFQAGLIHGDLSAYNILYWEGAITLIDFPQVVNSQSNRNAREILRRDVERVCAYFAHQGAPSDPAAITTT